MKSPWNYNDSQLSFDNIPLSEFCEKIPTPFYLYSCPQIKKNYQEFIDAAHEQKVNQPLVCFALKSNANRELLQTLASLGAGADIVSGGELRQALKSGIPANRIVFSGVGKQDWEIEDALNAADKGIYSFNVESGEELEDIERISKALGKVARVAFRLNPRVAAKTHKHISTGFKTHKFGILYSDVIELVKKYQKSEAIKIVGLSVHIGSQLTCMEATSEALNNLKKTSDDVSKILGRELDFLDVGGGLGVDYSPADKSIYTTPNDYMAVVSKAMTGFSGVIVFEPGRVISARAGLFVTKVIRKKESEDHSFIIVDGGMNDFVRTSLYEAYHEIFPTRIRQGADSIVDIVGPICETADCFAHQRSLGPVEKGDFLGVADTGAYGFTMASRYNMRNLPKEVVVLESGKWVISPIESTSEEI